MCTGRVGTAPHEAAADVGAAADGGDPQVGVDLVVEPAEAVGRERGAGGGDALDAREVEVAARVDAGLPAGHDIGGRGAEEGCSGLFRDAPLGADVRVAGAAVVQHEGGSGEEAGDEEVPHHPAGGGVPEEAVLGAEVAVQADLLEVLQQDAALGLDDRLGEPGGAGGVEHPERVVEGDLLEDRLGVGGREGGPFEGALGGFGAQQRDVDDGAQGGEFAAQFGDGVGAVVFLAAVAVAVDREEDHGFDLLEAVEDAAGAEVRGAGRPDASDGGGGEEGDDGLGDVGEVAADPVAGGDAECAEFGGERADPAAEFGPGDGDLGVGLVDVEQGGGVGAQGVLGGAQRVLGVVEGGAGEPLGAGHGAVGDDGLVRGGEPYVEPVGDGLPEGVEFVDGPLVQRRVATLGRGSVALGRPALEAGDGGGRDAVGAGLPEGASLAAAVMGRLPGCTGTRDGRGSAHTCWGVRVRRLLRTMPCDRLSHQGSPPMPVCPDMWSGHG